METGENGASGVHVVRRVKRENVPENENAIHQLHSMAERNVKGTRAKNKCATKMCLAQVTFYQTFVYSYPNLLCSVNASRTFYILVDLVDGNWGEWSAWSACSKTCKQGKQSRKRECNSPAPQNGGKKCEGESSQDQVCNQNIPCPGIKVRFFHIKGIYPIVDSIRNISLH